MAADILIVDDEKDIRDLISGILSDEGFRTRTAKNSDEALSAVQERRPSLVLLDIWLQGSKLDGLGILEQLHQHYPDMPVVMISGHGTIETAVQAIKLGAFDFVEKPFNIDRLVHIVARAVETLSLKREIKELKARSQIAERMVGTSNVMHQLQQTIQKIAPTNSRVLITGPAGTGKELVARQIHVLSPRSTAPFVVVQAAAITPENMEYEIFGQDAAHGRSRHIGALEEAHGGTLLIDEITEMPLETQNKFLRVLVDQSFTRVGGNTRVHVDVRILSSSSQDVQRAVIEERLREDLFHRLAVVPMRVPALFERRDDIPELVAYFADQIVQTAGLAPFNFADDAIAVLQAFNWPGNVRQLRNTLERAMIAASDKIERIITAADLPSDLNASLPAIPGGQGTEHIMTLPLRDAREVFEREYLLAQLGRFSGNISKTADFVGMERSALHRKLKSLGIGGE